MPRTHAPHPDPTRVALCGRFAVDVAPPGDEPNCPACKRALRRTPPAPPPAFEPPAPLHGDHRGAHVLTPSARRVLDRPAIRPAGVRWGSAEAALRALVRMRDEAAALRSPADPNRAIRIQSNRDPSLGGREHDAIERCRTVSLAMDRASRHHGLALSRACPTVTPDQGEQIFWLYFAGRGAEANTLRTEKAWQRRVSMSARDVAAEASAEFGVKVTADHVESIWGHYVGIVAEALRASGELGGGSRREPRRGSFAADPFARVRGD